MAKPSELDSETLSVALRLSNAVHDRRLRLGLTQAELATRAGVTVETVARLERVVRNRDSAHGNPSLSTLVALSVALCATPSELLVGADPRPASKPTDRGALERLVLSRIGLAIGLTPAELLASARKAPWIDLTSKRGKRAR